MRRRLACRLAALAAASTLVVAALGTGTSAADDTSCTRVAAPAGSDSAAGTEAAPFRSAQKLVERLDLDGHDAPLCSSKPDCHLPSPTVNGDHIVFQDNDVTNRHLGICFNLGAAGYGRAVDDVIQRNRIHDCGVLP